MNALLLIRVILPVFLLLILNSILLSSNIILLVNNASADTCTRYEINFSVHVGARIFLGKGRQNTVHRVRGLIGLSGLCTPTFRYCLVDNG